MNHLQNAKSYRAEQVFGLLTSESVNVGSDFLQIVIVF